MSEIKGAEKMNIEFEVGKMTNFEKYVNLIRQRAHEYADRFKVDYSEMESQGFLIYCECLEKFDITKSNFSTYLYIQLGRLGDFAKTYRRQQGFLIQDYYTNVLDYEIGNDYETLIEQQKENPSLKLLLDDAKQVLSDNAFLLMKWILGRSWERKYKRKPTLAMAVSRFNVPEQVIDRAWNECKEYWNKIGVELYS